MEEKEPETPESFEDSMSLECLNNHLKIILSEEELSSFRDLTKGLAAFSGTQLSFKETSREVWVDLIQIGKEIQKAFGLMKKEKESLDQNILDLLVQVADIGNQRDELQYALDAAGMTNKVFCALREAGMQWEKEKKEKETPFDYVKNFFWGGGLFV